jgi:hypothetical protein
MNRVAQALVDAWNAPNPPTFDREVRWLSRDSSRQMFVCRRLNAEYGELFAIIVAFQPIRVMTSAESHGIVCSSDDRRTSVYGRIGRDCGSCADRNFGCKIRWRIWLEAPDMELVFAHTLSLASSINFSNYATYLERKGLALREVVTELWVDTISHRSADYSYRCVQFRHVEE